MKSFLIFGFAFHVMFLGHATAYAEEKSFLYVEPSNIRVSSICATWLTSLASGWVYKAGSHLDLSLGKAGIKARWSFYSPKTNSRLLDALSEYVQLFATEAEAKGWLVAVDYKQLDQIESLERMPTVEELKTALQFSPYETSERVAREAKASHAATDKVIAEIMLILEEWRPKSATAPEASSQSPQ